MSRADDELLDRNLAVLARHQPELAARLGATPPGARVRVRPSRLGPPSLTADGLSLCSTVDPVAEGRDLAAQAPEGDLVVLGFGLGYHLEPVADRGLLVWEPRADVLRATLASRDLTGLLAKLRVVVDPPETWELRGRKLWVHRPTARLNPQAQQRLEGLLTRAAAPAGRPAHPRVMVVPPIYGGSLPVAHWSAQALTTLGCQVRVPAMDEVGGLFQRFLSLDPSGEDLERAQASLVYFLSDMLLAEGREFRPHLVLALAQAPMAARAAEELRAQGAVTAYWFVENHHTMPHWRDIAPRYEHFCHLQGPDFSAALSALGTRPHFLPMAAHPPVHRPLTPTEAQARDYGGRVGFMGEGYPNRRRIFASLVGRGLPLTLWGTGWTTQPELAALTRLGGRRLDTEEVVMVYNACSVVLNLHSSLEADRDDPGDYLNPRTFEVPACGGFMLSDQPRRLEEFFAPGRELAVYRDLDEVPGLVEHYLAHPRERRELAQAGRERVLAQHTYVHRMARLLDLTLGPAEADPDLEREREQARSGRGRPDRRQALLLLLDRLEQVQTGV